MARPLVSDELWGLIESLIPKVKRRYRYPGRSGWRTVSLKLLQAEASTRSLV